MLDEPVGPSPLDQREAVMEEIAATRREELRDDGLDIPPPDAGEEPAPEGEPETPVVESADEPGPEPRQTLPGEPLYTVTVDGQERQVPLSELTASYQIQDAAQNCLDQASRITRQAQERPQDVQGQPTATAPAVEQQPRDEFDGIDWGGLAEKLQYGEGAEAGNALKDLVVDLRNRGGSHRRRGTVDRSNRNEGLRENRVDHGSEPFWRGISGHPSGPESRWHRRGQQS